MQVNNVRIYLDSSSFPADFLANLLGCSHFRLENQAAWIPIPTRSSPTDPDPDSKHRTIVTSFILCVQQPPGTGPCGCEKSEQLFVLTGSRNSYCICKKVNYLFH